MGFRYRIQLAPRLCQLSRRYGKPGDESDVVLRAVVNDVFVAAVANIVLVLHADDVDDLASLFDLVRLNLAKTHVTDFALILKPFDCAERLLDGHLRIDAVKLPKVDSLQLQTTQAHLYLLDKIFGTSDRQPLIRSLTRETRLGGDDHALGIGR